MSNIVKLADFKVKEICVICSKKILTILDSNNAQPVSDGRCCNECNADQVIPQRIKELEIGNG